MLRKNLAVFLQCHLMILMLVILAVPAMAANAAPRDFAPVQNGFDPTGEKVLPYAADRLLIQFTSSAMERSHLNISMEKGAAVSNSLTGLSAVDVLAASAGVKSIARPYHQPQRQAAAKSLGVDRWFMLQFDTKMDMASLAESFAKDSDVAAVSVDWVAFPAAVPADPLYADHWGHNNTAQLPDLDWGGTYAHTLPTTVGTVGFDANAQSAWDGAQGYGHSGIVVAILDSGVDNNHPDLLQVAGYDFGDNDSDPDDNSGNPGHGTACAGVTASMNNNLGSAGIAADCSIMPCKVANSAGSMYFSYIQNALYWAADNGADVISMSFGAAISTDAATDAALAYAYDAGVALFAATGNENDNVVGYPAIHGDVFAVGAASPCGDRKRSSSDSADLNAGHFADPNGYTCDGERWWGSNYGSTSQDDRGAVDCLGPTILPTTDISGSGGYDSGDYSGFFNGTSCATPYVAGVAGLVIAANPTFTPAEVYEAIKTSAQDVTNVESGTGWDRYSGYGMVDAAAAVGAGGPVLNPPVTAFTGTPLSGDYPLLVAFTDQSTNSPTGYSWTFGDGGTSTASNPSYTYNAAGTYTVELTATNADGSDVETKVGYITVTTPAVPQPPVAAFSGSPTSGTYPLVVSFVDASTEAPTSWSWTFGDGGTSNAQNPSYTYNAAGVYTVAMTATNAQGSDSVTMTDYITVTEPGVTTFITAYGETSVAGTVSGTYASTKVSDGVNETITEELYADHPRKRSSFAEHNWTFTLPAGGDATFHLEASRTDNADGDDFVFEYTTDGVNYLPLATVSSSTEQTFSVALGALSGAVTVRVKDTDLTWDKISLDSLNVDFMAFELGDVQPVAPVADFTGTPTSGDYPLTVQFADASSGDPTSWSWTFGDGGTSTAQNPSYVYAAVGSYDVSLTATNAQGSDSVTKNGYITVTEPGVGGSEMHVSAMTVSRVKSGPNYFGTCVVTIMDDAGQPVGGATVTANYDGITSGTASGTTASDGTVTLQGANGMKRPSGEWCFEVTNVTLTDFTYDVAANVVTRACESGNIYSANGGFIPQDFSLEKNYPNPFNPMTTIKFNLPRDCNVSLKVYNVRGQMVTSLVNESLSAGSHEITWDARNQPSGMYFYRIETPGFTETRRMVMLK